MRKAWIILVLWIAHLVTTGAVFLANFNMGKARLDTGTTSSLGERLLVIVREILFFPLVTCSRVLPVELFDGLFGWIPVIANSVLWAVVVYGGVVFIARRRIGERR